MNDNILLFLMVLVVIVIAAAFFYSFRFGGFSQQHAKVKTGEVSETRAKNPAMTNPILWSYIIFPIAIVVGALMIYWMY